MRGRYRQSVVNSRTHFTQAPQGVIEFSRMHSPCKTETTGNAGDIIPLRAIEVLPNSTFSINADFDIRQATALVPSMDNMIVDIYAFFVPNRVVNKSWKSVQGENQSGQWVAPEVSLAPLCDKADSQISGDDSIQIPPNSVADYYGYPTQERIPFTVLQQSHDLLFRGYLDIYNNYFRNQNYQPPIPYSKLNVYNGFMLSAYPEIGLNGEIDSDTSIPASAVADNSYSNGAIINAIYGDGGHTNFPFYVPARVSNWSALDKPLKANKLHDYFTSVLPSPQKGREVVLSTLGSAPVLTGDDIAEDELTGIPLKLGNVGGSSSRDYFLRVGADNNVVGETVVQTGSTVNNNGYQPLNLKVDLTKATALTINDMRLSTAVQQIYEILGTSGSRYVEFVNSFFGLEVENPFDDIPTLLGHCRRNLDLYQVAQTSQGEGSSVGSLGAFGYTSDGGKLFDKTFLEHGYIHILGVIRHRNVYSSTLSRDKFRMSQLDFYLYPLANIGEQPVYTREINPFASGEDGKNVFGYQEAWSEYRFEPDIVTGLMRPGGEDSSDSLAVWNYADYFDRTLQFADGEFIKSNSAEVLNRSIAIADSEQPQFKIKIVFDIVKQLPMPTYSMPGLDIF